MSLIFNMRCDCSYPLFHGEKKERKERKKDKERRKDSDITNQEGQLNIHVNSIILEKNSVKKTMRRYLLSFKQAKTFFRIK